MFPTSLGLSSHPTASVVHRRVGLPSNPPPTRKAKKWVDSPDPGPRILEGLGVFWCLAWVEVR